MLFRSEIVVSIIWNESRFQPDRISNHNACGLMQIIPRWSIGKYTCNELLKKYTNKETTKDGNGIEYVNL